MGVRVRGLPAANVRVVFTVPSALRLTTFVLPIRVRMVVSVSSIPQVGRVQPPITFVSVRRVFRELSVNTQRPRVIPIRVRMAQRVLRGSLVITTASALRVTAEVNVKRQSQRVSPIRVKMGAFVFVVTGLRLSVVRMAVRVVPTRAVAPSGISVANRLTVATITALLL